jgi:hypothetical protein
LKLHELELYKKEIQDIQFLNVRAENIQEYTAEICWTTSVPTTSKLKYNVNPEKLEKMVTQINLSTDHRVALSGLLKGTDYYYQISVDDIRSEPFTSEVLKFRTKGIPLPLFTGYRLNPARDSVSITWQTNVGTRAMVEFGDSTGIKRKYPLKDIVVPQRKVVVRQLDPSTLYQFKIICVDTFKNGITTGLKTFRTRDWNVALNKPVEGSFTVRPDRYITTDPPILKRINDGSSSYFKGMATSGDVTRSIQQVVIDLEKEYEIDRIWVMWRRNAHSRDFSLYGSLDKKEWTALEKNIDAFKAQDGSSDSGDPTKITVTQCNGAKMRYIRLYIARGSAFYNKHSGRQNFVQIMEMRVYPVIKREYRPVLTEFYN